MYKEHSHIKTYTYNNHKHITDKLIQQIKTYTNIHNLQTITYIQCRHKYICSHITAIFELFNTRSARESA